MFLRPLTYFVGGMYASGYTRNPGTGVLLYIVVNLVFLAPLDLDIQPLMADWGQWMDFTFWSTIIAALGSTIGFLVPWSIGIPPVMGGTDDQHKWSWTNFWIMVAMLVVTCAALIPLDIYAWHDTWYSYVAAGMLTLTAHVGASQLFLTIPHMASAKNGFKLTTGLVTIASTLIVADAIFTLSGIVAWHVYVPLIIGTLIAIALIVVRVVGVFRRPLPRFHFREGTAMGMAPIMAPMST